MIENIPSNIYYQPFLQNRLVGFAGTKTAAVNLPSRNQIQIGDITIPKRSFLYNGKEFNFFEGIKFSQPMPLKESLIELSELKHKLRDRSYGVGTIARVLCDFSKQFASKVDKIPYLQDRKFHEITGDGANSLVINIGNAPKIWGEEVLKISSCPNFPEALGRRFEPTFDLPVHDSGEINGSYYCVQPKAITEGITDEHFEELCERIEKAGYVVDDEEMCEAQIGLYKDPITGKLKPFLLDPDCAVLPE